MSAAVEAVVRVDGLPARARRFCTPRFDSPSGFASLLDREQGGRFRIAPPRR